MAVIHASATISPTKLEFAQAWLDTQPWAPEGETEMIGAYRFDDPAGEVGIEGLLLRRGDVVAHLPVTYRGAPLEGAEQSLVSTMTHTALGDRWIYLAAADPVARAAFLAFVAGDLPQASLEIHNADGSTVQRAPSVTLAARGDLGKGTAADLQLVGNLGAALSGSVEIVATWHGGSGVVAVV